MTRLDDRWLAWAAPAVRRFGERRAALVSGLVRPGWVAAVRRAGEREPLLATSIAVVLAAGVLVGATGGDNIPDQPVPVVTSVPTEVTTGAITLGPSPGTSVSAYLARSRQLLAVAGGDARPRYALVSLRTATTATRLAALPPVAQVIRVWLRVPARVVHTSAGPVLLPAHHFDVAPTGGIAGAILTAHQQALEQLASYQRVIAGLQARNAPGSAGEIAGVRVLLAQAAAEVGGFSQGCVCVVGLLVQAPGSELAQVAAFADVRAVEPAPAGTPAQLLAANPLLPEDTATVHLTGTA